MPGPLGSGIGIALVGLLFFNQLGIGFSLRLAPSYRASDAVAAELRAAGAHAGQVMSTSWTYYDTRSPLKDRYAHLPIYVNSLDGVVTEMERRGATYLVFDRQTGAEHWPELASLIETERLRPRLRAVHAPIRTDESPPNAVAIYRLD